MRTEGPITKKLFAARHDILRGDSVLAVLIFVVVSIFLVNLIASIWHNVHFQKDVRQEASLENAKVVGGMLAKTGEVLLIANELSMLRRTVAETGLEHHLSSCRVVLPDGGVVADSDPAGIDVINLPDSWEGGAGSYSETRDGDMVTFRFPLEVPGRGRAFMEISESLSSKARARLEPQTAQMAIACLALATMLLVQRHARFRLKAIGAIHDVLSAVTEGTDDVSTLELDPELGTEAVAWNKLLGEKQGQQVSEALKHIKVSMGEESEGRIELTQMCDVLPQGLILVSADRCIEYANGAAAVLLQTERSDLAHQELSHAIDDPQVIQAVQDVLGGGTRPSVVERQCDDGTTSGVLRFTMRPICGDDARSVMVLIEDITQQRIAEAARNSFLAKAAHELRTPLTNIRLYVENAVDHCGRDPQAVAKCLNVINDESRRLERTVSEVLSVSEIEAGSFDLQHDDVHLDSLMQQIQADHEANAQKKKITLRFDLPPKLPVISADRDKISLAMHNLVGNALKYTPENGQVTVSLMVENGRITLDVTDTGIGISKDDLPRVFDKFYRATDQRVTDITGSGLGLAIAREIISLHGGFISVESELNSGSTFTLALPVAEEDAPNESPNTTARSRDRS
jgi:signal transduction histidine kinase